MYVSCDRTSSSLRKWPNIFGLTCQLTNLRCFFLPIPSYVLIASNLRSEQFSGFLVCSLLKDNRLSRVFILRIVLFKRNKRVSCKTLTKVLTSSFRLNKYLLNRYVISMLRLLTRVGTTALSNSFQRLEKVLIPFHWLNFISVRIPSGFSRVVLQRKRSNETFSFPRDSKE